MNTQDYHKKRNELYQKLVEAKLIEDTDDNFETFDTLLGNVLDVDWSDRGVNIVHVGVGSGTKELAEQLALLHVTGQPPRIILVDDSPRAETIADVFNEPLTMKLSNYRVDDYLLTTPKYDGCSGSKFIKPNSTKNWKK